MASNFKNDRAWTPQDVKALECAMMNQLEIGFTSIDRDEIPNPNKLPLDAKPTDFMGRKLELEKSIFINSSILVKEMVAKVENAKENDDKEVGGIGTNVPGLFKAKAGNLLLNWG